MILRFDLAQLRREFVAANLLRLEGGFVPSPQEAMFMCEFFRALMGLLETHRVQQLV
jgi:hypothetical protein